MPPIRDMARITLVGGEFSADEVAQAAWLLWSRVHTDIKRKHFPPKESREGVPGFELRGSLVHYVFDLWPEYADWDDETKLRFRGALYSYLKSTNNAHCLVPSKKPVWWISASFNKVAVQRVYGGSSSRSKEQARLEGKLTRKEAGEDRDHAPVTVTQRKVAAQPMPETEPVPQPPVGRERALMTIHEQRSQTREARRQAVKRIIDQMQQPATIDEIRAALNQSGVPADTTTVRGDINFLLDQGLVKCRTETRDERAMRAGGIPQKAQRARLFWPTEPVPERTTRELVAGVVAQVKQVSGIDRSAHLKYFSEMRHRIRQAPFTASDISEASTVGTGTIRHLLTEDVKAGLIVQANVPAGKSGRNKYYRVNRDAADQVRARGYDADAELKLKLKRKATPEPVAPPAPDPTLTSAEQHSLRIIKVIQDEGTQRENILMAKADLNRDEFEQAIELLMAAKYVKRFELLHGTFYGDEEPVISDPPPSVATAAITQLEKSPLSLAEEGFALIRQALEAQMTNADPRIKALELEVIDLKRQLRKAQAAAQAAMEA